MKCLVWKQRITTDGWEPFCSEICRDSAEAEFQREIESEGAEFSPEEERRVMSARFAGATYAGVPEGGVLPGESSARD